MASHFQRAQGGKTFSLRSKTLVSRGLACCLHPILVLKGNKGVGTCPFCLRSGPRWEKLKGRNWRTNKMHLLLLCEDILGKFCKCPRLLSRFHQTSSCVLARKNQFYFLLSYIRFLSSLRLINSTPSDSLAFLMIKVVGFLKRPPISASSAPIRTDKSRVKITRWEGRAQHHVIT